MPYCPECGTPVNAGNKFCPSCGTKIQPIQQRDAPTRTTQTAPPNLPSTPTQIQPPPPQFQDTPSEHVKTIIPNFMVAKSWGRYDIYNLIVTDRRSIFSKLTNEMMNKTIQARRAKAEAEGKGFFGKWKAQMQGFNTYTDYYQRMTPDQILMEGKDNFSLDNSTIHGLKIKDETSDEGGMSMYYIEIQTQGKNLQFKTQYDPTEALEAAYHLKKK
jgi:uncharacterized Zn finger protein (UPF0148 family)